MPSTRFARRQRIIGGLVGLAVLLFALAYHFFPDALNVAQRAPARKAVPEHGSPAPMGFEQRPVRRHSEATAGPPIALAPRAVLERRERERMAAALAGIAHASTAPETPATPAVASLLAQADSALAAGNLAGSEDSAATLYAQALRAKSDSRRAAAGLARVHVQLVLGIEQHLADGEADAAAGELALLKQLPGTASDVKRLDQRLASLRKVRPLLAHAAALVQQGKALAPKGDNALAVYRNVLDIDPNNTVAEHGIEHIQQQVLDQALGAVAREDFAAANAALAHAARILPGSQALQDTHGRIEGIRRQRAAGVLEQARTALDSGNVQLAEELKAKALTISPDVQGVDKLDKRLHDARVYASLQPGQVFSDRFLDMPGEGPAMVVVPIGSFSMGSADGAPGHAADESPQHEVHITQGFAIGRSEVTVGQFRTFVRASGYVPDSVRLGGASVYDGRTGAMRNDGHATWQDDYSGRPAAATLPVVNVSWNDAHAYAQWLSKRTGKDYQLPSETQFAYALRGGTTTLYWWGDGVPTRIVENVTGSGDHSRSGRRWTHAFKGYSDGYWGPAPIQSFLPNPFGLYDMAGNVSEWTRDCWHENFIRAPDDDGAWINPGCTTRVIRGGSWGSAPEQVRSAFRMGASAATRSGRVGFRVVRVL